MISIHLQKLIFFAHHGLHGEEAVVGAQFEVSLTVSVDPGASITSIKQTVDYCVLYEIVKSHMTRPLFLLETLAENIAADVKSADSRIESLELTIVKLQPPIEGFSGRAGITLTKDFSK